jgi:DNA-binding beta-propeller fold protein YncE
MFDPLAIAVDDRVALQRWDARGPEFSPATHSPWLAGSNTQTVLPLSGLNGPLGVAVDTADNLYVVDSETPRVVKLPAKSTVTIIGICSGAVGFGAVAMDQL